MGLRFPAQILIILDRIVAETNSSQMAPGTIYGIMGSHSQPQTSYGIKKERGRFLPNKGPFFLAYSD